MNVARFNMSHDNQSIHADAIASVRRTSEEAKLPVKIMIDLRGPEVRCGKFAGGSAVLETGRHFVLTSRQLLGDSNMASMSQSAPMDAVSVGNRIFLSDGLIELRAENIINTDIICKIVSGGKISDNKSIGFPDTDLNLPYLGDGDKSDILFAVKENADMLALSFVSSPADVLSVRKYINEHGGGKIKLISKIENQSGVDNIDEIIKVSDGIMIARGDLGTEIPLENLPHIQKEIICRCLGKDCFVITATEMLESMTEKPRPTRAEATDVANAVYDGTDAVMLSGETARGRHPALAVEYMYKLVDATESYIFNCRP